MPRRRKDLKSSSDEESECGLSKLHHPVQRHAANERERSRMRVLSKAFSKLKTTLPWVPSDTKLSKLDTLRLASSYIAHLKQILDGDEDPIACNQSKNVHPMNLTWPFSFQSKMDGGSMDTSKSDQDSNMSTMSDERSLDDLVGM